MSSPALSFPAALEQLKNGQRERTGVFASVGELEEIRLHVTELAAGRGLPFDWYLIDLKTGEFIREVPSA